MEQTQYLLVYSDSEDPVTQWIQNHSDELKDRMTILSVGDILNNVKIHDVIDNGTAKLSWKLANGQEISNSSSTTLINRVFHLQDQLFEDFHPEDRSYAYQEFWAYLSFALDSFQVKTSSPSFLGLNNSAAPMPLQWRTLSQSQLPVTSPRYYFGSRSFMPISFLDQNYVHGEIHSFHKWTPISAMEKESLLARPSSDQVFLYERPTGNPLRAFVFGNKTVLIDLKTQQELEDSRISATALEIAKLFGHSIAEMILFLDGNEICFGALRNQLGQSAKKLERFGDLVKQGVLQ